MALIAPSILAADLGHLEREVQAVGAAGADWIHFDVMDGNFVPPITFGPALLKAARAAVNIPLDVHLMIERPEGQVAPFAEAGADIITVHIEACPHVHRIVQQIKEHGARAGIALNPGTPLFSVADILPEIDLLLVMTVNPGWGGQKFIEASLEKIRQAAALIRGTGRSIHLEVDGGITPDTAPRVRAAGANVLVSGTAVFRSSNYAAAIQSLRQ